MHAISHLLLHSLVQVRLVALVGPLVEAVLLVQVLHIDGQLFWQPVCVAVLAES